MQTNDVTASDPIDPKALVGQLEDALRATDNKPAATGGGNFGHALAAGISMFVPAPVAVAITLVASAFDGMKSKPQPAQTVSKPQPINLSVKRQPGQTAAAKSSPTSREAVNKASLRQHIFNQLGTARRTLEKPMADVGVASTKRLSQAFKNGAQSAKSFAAQASQSVKPKIARAYSAPSQG